MLPKKMSLKSNIARLLRFLSVVVAVVVTIYAMLSPSISRFWKENHTLPFNEIGFNKIISEVRTEKLKPLKDGKIVLPVEESYLTCDGCVYVTYSKEHGTLIFFPTIPLTWSIPSVHFYSGYLYCCDTKIQIKGQSISINAPVGTPKGYPFGVRKIDKSQWYKVWLSD